MGGFCSDGKVQLAQDAKVHVSCLPAGVCVWRCGPTFSLQFRGVSGRWWFWGQGRGTGDRASSGDPGALKTGLWRPQS